jgi:hypothetical protein
MSSEEVLKLAVPEESVPLPSVAAPSLKVTEPVGVPAPGATAATVAVKVTVCPYTLGLAEELTDVVVLAWFTVCVSGAAVLSLSLKLPSPL